jgi:hypothetical protein
MRRTNAQTTSVLNWIQRQIELLEVDQLPETSRKALNGILRKLQDLLRHTKRKTLVSMGSLMERYVMWRGAMT